ncbi:MAG: aminotransferase class V-fold PLP-dependent enzyme [Brachymonas sp.]|nr:aminotransferase class V-fold PLP-dependent enzyme [Brachymonas sp.]
MPALLPHVDPDGLLEFSVVYTDRALNHMSKKFVGAMQDILGMLGEVYGAHTSAIVPGSGTYGMEAVARQFAQDKKVLVLRNGFFSYRWSQIFEVGRITDQVTVLKARPASADVQAAWEPAPIDEVVETIRKEKPALVFAPHVETASGILLPDDYLKQVSAAAHEVGALFVLDCIASGAAWVNMRDCGIDILVSAPQKGWSASPCGAMVCFSEKARQAIEATTSDSFACDLKKWLAIAEGYVSGKHAYHATMPTDALLTLRDAMQETRKDGFDVARQRQLELGQKMRAMLESRGFASVAAEGFKAPGVVVSHTTDPGIQNGSKFIEAGLQTASGVPLMCDEPQGFSTFRLGLFGLDKLRNVDRTVGMVQDALDRMGV